MISENKVILKPLMVGGIVVLYEYYNSRSLPMMSHYKLGGLAVGASFASNFISDMMELPDTLDFVKSPISNYKNLASIYKIFEATTTKESFEPKDIVNSKFTIVENIINSSIENKDKKVNDRVLEEYRKQDEEVRMLSYKMLVENFNKKYNNLSEQQKNLLKEYINNINNTGKLKEYVNSEVNSLSEGLKDIGSKVSDKVTKIKLAETISNIKKIKSVKKLKESHLSALMMSYELLKELKDSLNK